jgi:tetratricopeptide (TPR) repeat protein
VEFLKKVLATQPDHAEANYELGKELRIEGKASESLSYLEAAVRLKPGFEPAHYQLQSAYRTVGRSEDADREARIYRALKTKSRNITLPPPRKPAHENPSSD